MNKTFIAISLIITIFFMIFSILEYNGIIRYFKLYTKNSFEKFVKNYSHKRPFSSTHKTVISLTTTKQKINKLLPVLNSLLDQTVKVNQISLNFPDNYEKQIYKVPKHYENIVNVYRSGKDYGIYNNLIPTLLREVENNTLIICLKDNYIYGNDFIENIIQDSDNSNEIIQNNYCTVLKPKFVNKNIVNYDKNNFDMDWVKTHSKVPIKYKKYSNIFKKF